MFFLSNTTQHSQTSAHPCRHTVSHLFIHVALVLLLCSQQIRALLCSPFSPCTLNITHCLPALDICAIQLEQTEKEKGIKVSKDQKQNISPRPFARTLANKWEVDLARKLALSLRRCRRYCLGEKDRQGLCVVAKRDIWQAFTLVKPLCPGPYWPGGSLFWLFRNFRRRKLASRLRHGVFKGKVFCRRFFTIISVWTHNFSVQNNSPSSLYLFTFFC